MFGNETILVTGGKGLLGQAVVVHLLARGIPPERIKSPSHAECDLRDVENCKRVVEGVGVVLHLAARTGGLTLHRNEPGNILYDNTLMNLNLLAASREAGVRKFVGIGSAAAYPKESPLPSQEEYLWGPFDSEALHASYNFSKLALLLQGLAYRKESNFNAVHLIATNMYGPGDNGRTGYVIPTLIARIREAKKQKVGEIEVWGTPHDTRDFLFSEDAAAAIVAAAELYDEGAPVNIASGKEVSIGELVETLCRLMDFSGTVRFEKPEALGSRRLLDTTKARELLKWESTTSLEEGLKKTLVWFDKEVT